MADTRQVEDAGGGVLPLSCTMFGGKDSEAQNAVRSAMDTAAKEAGESLEDWIEETPFASICCELVAALGRHGYEVRRMDAPAPAPARDDDDDVLRLDRGKLRPEARDLPCDQVPWRSFRVPGYKVRRAEEIIYDTGAGAVVLVSRGAPRCGMTPLSPGGDPCNLPARIEWDDGHGTKTMVCFDCARAVMANLPVGGSIRQLSPEERGEAD